MTISLCPHNAIAPDSAMNALPTREQGIARWGCAVCAYQEGVRKALSGEFKNISDYRSSILSEDRYECPDGKISDAFIISNLARTQAGKKKGVSVFRHKCPSCSFEKGFLEGLKEVPKDLTADNFTVNLVNAPSVCENNRGPSETKINASYGNISDREKANKLLGSLGEQVIIAQEKSKLLSLGHHSEANLVEWVAVTRGDHLGFDIQSFFAPKRERWIEVKTTRGSINTPFHISENQIICSRKNPDKFSLYRVFDFNEKTKSFSLYILDGYLGPQLNLHPLTFRAAPK